MDIFNTALSWIKEQEKSKYIYLGPLIIGLLATISYIANHDINLANMTKTNILIVASIWFLVIVICVALRWTRRFPRFKANECGVLFIIDTYEEQDRKIIEKYLLSDVRRKFESSLLYNAKVLFLPEYQTKKFSEMTKEERKQIISKSGAKLAFYGEGKTGHYKQKEVYKLSLGSVVTHDNIPIQLSRYLSAEMFVVMKPISQIIIPTDDTIVGYDVLTASIKYIADYILAAAFFRTEHYSDAQKILESNYVALKSISRNIPAIATLKNIVPIKLRDTYILLADSAYKKFLESKDKGFLDEMHVYIEKQEKIGKTEQSYYVQNALYYFCKERNVKKAKEYIKKCEEEKYKEFAWQYDKVFLNLYASMTNQTIAASYRKYKTLLRKNPDINIEREVEEFILDLLDFEPDKIQMKWLLAMLMNARNEFILSEEYLSQFVNELNIECSKETQKYIDHLRRCNSDKRVFYENSSK